MKKALCLVLGFIVSAWAERLELVGSTPEGAGLGIQIVSDTLAFIVQGGAGLKIINVAHPEIPTVVGSCKTAYKAVGLFVKDSLCFVADWDSGLTVVNVSNPENPYVIGRCPTLTPSANSVWVVDTVVVVAGLWSKTWTVNAADPSNPILIGEHINGDDDLFVQWPLAFVAAGNGGAILDLSDPTKPVRLATAGASWGVWVSDTLLFTSAELQIYNIADPTKPKLLGYAGPEPEFYSYAHLWGSGHYVYVTAYHGGPGDPTNDGIVVYDVSDPTNPKCTAKYAKEYGNFYHDIFVVDSRVYAVTDGALLIFDHITGIKEEPKPIRVVSPWLKVFPNPSNTQFTIRYGLSEMSTVSLRIYDVAGRLVKRLNSGASSFGPGVYTLQWNGRDNFGYQVPTGVYFLKLSISGKQAITQKAVLLH